jgi:hypothetical protein
MILSFKVLDCVLPMRGSDKLKAIHSLNQDTLKVLIKALILYNIITLLIYFNKSKSFILFSILSTLEIASTFFLFKICKPKIGKDRDVEKLENVISINSPGPASFCWDVLFWGMMGKVLIVFGWGFGVVYLGIPLTFFYEFLYKPYKKLKLN